MITQVSIVSKSMEYDVIEIHSLSDPSFSDIDFENKKKLGSELPLSNLVDGLEDVADRLDRHVAAKDDDNDGFSDIGALRGYWWKGIDFEDEDNQVYPGRFPDDGDEYFDSNCNYLEGRIQDPGRSKS